MRRTVRPASSAPVQVLADDSMKAVACHCSAVPQRSFSTGIPRPGHDRRGIGTLIPSILEQIEAVPSRSVLDLPARPASAPQTTWIPRRRQRSQSLRPRIACYAADRDRLLSDVERLVDECNRIGPAPGWFTETFCLQSRFIHPRNGGRIDAIREHLEGLDLEPELKSVMLVSLMEAADRVDSTTGVQMAYLKKWAARAMKDLEPASPTSRASTARKPWRMPRKRPKARVDVAYLDPPWPAFLPATTTSGRACSSGTSRRYGIAYREPTARPEKPLQPQAGDRHALQRHRFGEYRAAVVSFNNEECLP